MSTVTTQQLSRYFEQFAATDVTFTRQVLAATGLVTKNVYLKVQDRQWPCIVFSSSMQAARVIVTVKEALLTAVGKANNRINLRWCFKTAESSEPITFFVACHAGGFTPYDPVHPEVQVATLDFTQRPPDDLIAILGRLLDANANAQRRREERIPLSRENAKKLGLETREAILTVNGVLRRCVLRDVSFGGANVLTSAVSAAAVGSTATLRIARGDQGGELAIKAIIRRVDEVEGTKDIVAVAMEYSPEPPMSYKLLINTYLSAHRKTVPPAHAPAPAAPAAAPPAPSAQAGAPSFPEEEKPGRDGSDSDHG